MKRILAITLTALALTSCGNLQTLPPGTGVTVGGKNPVAVDVSGQTWKQALASIGTIAATYGVQLAASYGQQYVNSKLAAGSAK